MKSLIKKPVIAVIGAKGKMAKEFVKLFKKAEIVVLEVDVKTKLTLAQALSQADITIVSVPISVTVDVLTEVLKCAKPSSLVADLTSIKLPIEKAFVSSNRTDIEMVGLHPMFGPSMIADMRGQIVAYCPFKTGTLTKWLTLFFKSHGALLKKTSAHEHDECMAVIQGITHFSAIASGMALEKLGADVKKTKAFASPIYSLRLAMIGRILSQSPELYADIEIENPRTVTAVHAYMAAIEELNSAITSKDKSAFIKMFNGAAEFLGSYTTQAQKETDRIIRLMHKHL